MEGQVLAFDKPKPHVERVNQGSQPCMGTNQHTIIMEAIILRIEGRYEIIGYFLNGVKIKETRRLVTNWK